MQSEGTQKRVANAVTELSKGMKNVGFYPNGHPALIQSLAKIIATFEEIPLPETGLEIGVTKNALISEEEPVPVANKAVSDLNRELYLRRISKVIFLPGITPEELFAFLSVLTRDPDEIRDAGGIEQALFRSRVSHIWANRVDYEGLTELLKRQEEPAPEEAPELKDAELALEFEEAPIEEDSIETLLKKIEKETNASAYRDHIIALSRILFSERMDRKIEYASRALAIFASHIQLPPRQDPEIANLARLGVKELASDEIIDHHIRLLQGRESRGRGIVETILVAFEDRAVKPLFAVLAEEQDLIVRKSVVDIIIRIGRPAVPIILDSLNDNRWYIVRNVITILGSLGMPDLAPHIAAALSHPDLRVKKEAIKALSRLNHPSAVTALGELCFFPEETVALTATAALAAKRDQEAILTLYRRAVLRNVLYPKYRLAH